MKYGRTIGVLVVCIMIVSAASAAVGIFTHDGPGPFVYESIRGEEVMIHGYGLYKHMSADVAVQGIGQDYVTLFLAVPLLGAVYLIARQGARTGSLRGQFLLAGVLGYFLVTYLFYLVMGMYNVFFLAYAFLLGTSFFGLALVLLGIDLRELPSVFKERTPVKMCGGFLIFNSVAIAWLWLGVVLPPLLNGSIYPESLQHYTTLIVQGLDLGLLLPLSFVSGLLLIQRRPMGYLLAPAYLVFLSLLMTALVAKIIAMSMLGVNVIPVIFIIPTILLFTILCAVRILRSIGNTATASPSSSHGA